VDVKRPLPLSTLDLSTLLVRLLVTDLWKARLALQLALLVLSPASFGLATTALAL